MYLSQVVYCTVVTQHRPLWSEDRVDCVSTESHHLDTCTDRLVIAPTPTFFCSVLRDQSKNVNCRLGVSINLELGRVDDFSYFDCSSSFCFLLVEFH